MDAQNNNQVAYIYNSLFVTFYMKLKHFASEEIQWLYKFLQHSFCYTAARFLQHSTASVCQLEKQRQDLDKNKKHCIDYSVVILDVLNSYWNTIQLDQ